MKKVILTLAAIALAFAANAQFVIGGDLAISANGGHDYFNRTTNATTTEYTTPLDRTFDFTFAPKVGYQINDNMQVGLGLGFGVGTTREYKAAGYVYADFEGWVKTTSFNWYVAPYFRYSWGLTDKLSIFAEAQVTIGGTPYVHTHDFNTAVVDGGITLIPARDIETVGNTRYFNFGISITPGLNYKFNDHVSADLYIDLAQLGYGLRKSTTIVEVGNTVTENDIVNHDFYFGILSSVRTLNTDLSWFRLGFNYTF